MSDSEDLPTTLPGLRAWAREDVATVRERFGSLGSRSLNWRPAPDRGVRPLEGSWLGRWFTRMSAPVVKRRITAPGSLRPSESKLPVRVVDDYVEQHRRLLELLDVAARRDVEGLKVPSGDAAHPLPRR